MDDLKLCSRIEKVLDSLVQTVGVFSEDIRMEFDIEKCAKLVMEREKFVKSVDIEVYKLSSGYRKAKISSI